MKNALKSLLAVAVFAALTQGCSTTSGSLGAGAGIGGLAGAGVGALADPGPGGENRARNVVIGAAAGGLIGAGVGYAVDRSNRDAKEDGKRQGRKEAEDEWRKSASASGSGGAPELVPAKTEARWVPDQVKGSTFVPGHFEYSIVSPAKWEAK